MKANEFVKQHGFDGAYELWEGGSFNLFENDLCILSGFVCRLSDSEPLFSCDLKRLIESHELVEKYKNKHGGIRFRIRWGMYRYGDTQQFNDRLKQAIADVESCQ